MRQVVAAYPAQPLAAAARLCKMTHWLLRTAIKKQETTA